MIDLFFNIVNAVMPYSAAYGAFVAFCTILVKTTSTKKDDAVWEKVIKVLDFFSTAFRKLDLEKMKKAKKNWLKKQKKPNNQFFCIYKAKNRLIM